MSKSERLYPEKKSIDANILNSLNTQQIIELIELCKKKLQYDGVIRTGSILRLHLIPVSQKV
ncbi:MAG: hypothetical protein ACOXZU_08755 [Bacteroidales bacterium]|jgi:hypothetical protein